MKSAASAAHADAMANLGVPGTKSAPPGLAGARAQWERAAAAGGAPILIDLGAQAARLDPPNLPVARACLEAADGAEHTGAMSEHGVLLATDWEPADLLAARGWLGGCHRWRHRRDE